MSSTIRRCFVLALVLFSCAGVAAVNTSSQSPAGRVVYDVRAFGAKGDGKTLDTGAINTEGGSIQRIEDALARARAYDRDHAAAVALHARTAEQRYAGDATWAAIAELKAAVTEMIEGRDLLGGRDRVALDHDVRRSARRKRDDTHARAG